MRSMDGFIATSINTLTSGLNQAVCAKTIGSHVVLRVRNSGAESGRELSKGSKDAASLLVCSGKKFFGWGVRIFCE